MTMDELKGLLIINGTDIWITFGAFLVEKKRGGRENLTAIMTPSKAKSHVGVNIRERDGIKYSDILDARNDERDVTLYFALFARTKDEWLRRYRDFITFLKRGKDGWLSVNLSELDLTMRMFYVDCGGYEPLTYLWKEGVQASRFKIRFREPEPSF